MTCSGTTCRHHFTLLGRVTCSLRLVAVDGIQCGLIKLGWHTVKHHAPLGQADDAIAKLFGVIHLVQIADHSNAQLTRSIAQVLQHAACSLGVQAGYRFVSQNHLGLLGKSPCNAHALHLPARQRLGALVGLVGQTHTLQACVGQISLCLNSCSTEASVPT